ncbi:hypothetical protein WOLCODRAFT_139906 [Wolfiporia cocos MD-104 SS10]|uniref:Uncharacterized protein n=1 Tax=Wolfiporia cocos (strain MD-104) TaxID=742152 RepID=A0A2H3J6R5_WOLCO|nr:hypothetical protein WOLCODRAFT_139906 [Wolfiporia cocos MD-104 SS10]
MPTSRPDSAVLASSVLVAHLDRNRVQRMRVRFHSSLRHTWPKIGPRDVACDSDIEHARRSSRCLKTGEHRPTRTAKCAYVSPDGGASCLRAFYADVRGTVQPRAPPAVVAPNVGARCVMNLQHDSMVESTAATARPLRRMEENGALADTLATPHYMRAPSVSERGQWAGRHLSLHLDASAARIQRRCAVPKLVCAIGERGTRRLGGPDRAVGSGYAYAS